MVGSLMEPVLFLQWFANLGTETWNFAPNSAQPATICLRDYERVAGLLRVLISSGCKGTPTGKPRTCWGSRS